MKNIKYIVLGLVVSICTVVPNVWAQDDEMNICASVVPCFKGEVKQEFLGSASEFCTNLYIQECQQERIQELEQQNQSLAKQVAKLKKSNKKNRK